MLSVTLKTLEADGLIRRTVYPQIPPKVEYELTPMGKSLMPHLHDLAQWALVNMDQIKASRQQYEHAMRRN
jgi:DNA-binding HxlR family transcriptional regulator